MSALLVLEDGTQFSGTSIGAAGECVGEVVFNTAMTGYQEILTDPSYAKQIVTLTYPHIGNTGSNDGDAESAAAQAAGLIIRDLPLLESNWRSETDLGSWLREHNVVAIADIDTRKLTRLIREKGAQAGTIVVLDESASSRASTQQNALDAARAFPGLAGMDLAKEVTCDESYEWLSGTWQLETDSASTVARDSLPLHVVAMDFGVKQNILRMLVARGCRVTVVPARATAKEILDLKPDGVFLSNGPGDPEPCEYAISAISDLLGQDNPVPVFGICLGHQLLALASGAKTLKMKFGHHGANHPVLDIDTGRVMISSQNHGFAVDPDSLGNHLRVTHKSLFDDSLQGVERTDIPAFGFQGHPEASPGPHDVAALFDRFIDMMHPASRG